MEEGGEEAGSGKPSPVSPSQTEDKPPVLAWIKTEPAEDEAEVMTGHLEECDGTCKPSFVIKSEISDNSYSSECGDHTYIKQEEFDFGKGEVVMRGKDFVVKRDPDYESDEEEEEVDVKYEAKEESESGEMEVCADSSAGMAGANSSTRQTGQSLCPASACLASSGGEAAAEGRGRGGENGVSRCEGEDLCEGERPPADLTSGVFRSRSPKEREPAVPQGNPKTLPCSECGKMFHSEFNLARHLSSVHRGLRNYSCSDCGRKFHQKSTLERHLLVHKCVGGARECENFCGTKQKPSSGCSDNLTGTDTSMEREPGSAHRVDEGYICPECGKEFRWKVSVKVHLATVHGGEKKFSCSVCGEAFCRNSSLNMHVAIVHRGATDFSCSECGKKFQGAHTLKMHLAAVHGDQQNISCHDCGNTFRYRSSLKYHMASVHRGERNFTCSECGRAFGHRGHLNKHVAAVHKGVKTLSCPECEKKFFEKDELEKHLAIIHHIRNVLACLECCKTFSSSDHLKEHLAREHGSERKFSCPQCGSTFDKKLNLQVHFAVAHKAKAKTFCSECCREFSAEAYLKLHISTVHQNEVACSECGVKVPMIFMKRHLAEAHGSEHYLTYYKCI